MSHERNEHTTPGGCAVASSELFLIDSVRIDEVGRWQYTDEPRLTGRIQEGEAFMVVAVTARGYGDPRGELPLYPARFLLCARGMGWYTPDPFNRR